MPIFTLISLGLFSVGRPLLIIWTAALWRLPERQQCCLLPDFHRFSLFSHVAFDLFDFDWRVLWDQSVLLWRPHSLYNSEDILNASNVINIFAMSIKRLKDEASVRRFQCGHEMTFNFSLSTEFTQFGENHIKVSERLWFKKEEIWFAWEIFCCCQKLPGSLASTLKNIWFWTFFCLLWSQ